MIRTISGLVTAFAAMAGILAATPVSAATTLNFGGGSSATSGTFGNTRNFIASGGLQVQASAWSYDGAALSKAYLGWYGNGLGVTNAGEGTGGSSSHAVDNYLRRDFVLLIFNQAVNLASGVLTPYQQTTTAKDNDAAISNTNVAGLFAAGAASLTTSDPLFATLSTNLWNVPGNAASPYTVGFASTGRFGNVWLVGAASVSTDGTADGFKLTSLSVNAVPEPGTWAMMLLGFAATGMSLRKRRTTALLPQAA